MKVAELHNTTHNETTGCKSYNTTNPVDDVVAKEASQWNLKFDLTMLIPATFSALFVTSLGDRVGRKVAMTIPVVGILLSNVFLAFVVCLGLPLKTLFLYYFLAGSGGYYMTLLMQGYAYLSDIIPNESRGIRMVFIDTCLGIGGGVSGITTRYLIDFLGYFVLVLACILMAGVALVIIYFLHDSRVLHDKILNERRDDDVTINEEDANEVLFSQPASSSSSISDNAKSTRNESFSSSSGQTSVRTIRCNLLDLMRSVWNVYSSEYSHCNKCHVTRKISSSEVCPHGGGRYPGRVWRMWFYLISYNVAMFLNVGTQTFTTIYLLSQPLCFNPALVGIQSGLKFVVILCTPLAVLFYQRCFNLSNNSLILVSFVGWLLYLTMMSFATEIFVVFLATCVMAFGNAQTSFIKAQMSSLVSESEYGATFALLSSSDVITFLVSTISFLSLYSATISIFHGFAWLFAASLLVVPVLLMTCVWYADRQEDRISFEEERQSLIS